MQMLNDQELSSIFKYTKNGLFWKVDRKSNKTKGKKAGSLGKNGYWFIRLNNKTYLEHRIVYFLHNKTWPQQIDHIDGNKLNNCIENLRQATTQQNQQNTSINKKNSSGYKNVSWSKSAKKWQIQIKANGKNFHFGYFDDIELADLVAQEARHKYHKEFARH